MKHLVLAFALVAFAAGCRTSHDTAVSDAGAPPAADCCAEKAADCGDKAAACADKAAACADKAAACSKEGKSCPVTGKSMN